MSFLSWEFLILVICTFVLYFTSIFQRFQVHVLVIASLIFYSWDQWRLLPLLLLAVLLTYISTLYAAKGSRLAVLLGVAGNLGILGFFKYKFLFLDAKLLSAGEGASIFDTLLRLPLPIGISFFTFHNISLIVDYFHYGRTRPRVRFVDVLLYILFFPQLVSGPITRAMSFLPQIATKRLAEIPVVQVAKLLILGFFFKLYVANNLAQFNAKMTGDLMQQLGSGDKLVSVFAYSAQIYADFFGYSTIALGLGLLFGYRLPVNFNRPYRAASFSDFWNRWHISLSTWLRTYLYLPLGGNRAGRLRTYVNLMAVMALGGLWHGAAFSYLIWGILHGSFLVVERFFKNIISEEQMLQIRKANFLRVAYSCFIFICISFAWLFFRFEHFPDAIKFIAALGSGPLIFSEGKEKYVLMALYLLPVIIQTLFDAKQFTKGSIKREVLLYSIMLWLTFMERGADTPFIYFRF